VTTDPNEVQSIAHQQPEVARQLRQRLDAFTREVSQQRMDDGDFGKVDGEVMNHLRALGYIE
jgi:hypothetical protein